MCCADLAQLEQSAQSARLELNRASTHGGGAGSSSVYSSPERSARTALFSAEIDIAVHRARCVVCATIDQ